MRKILYPIFTQSEPFFAPAAISPMTFIGDGRNSSLTFPLAHSAHQPAKIIIKVSIAERINRLCDISFLNRKSPLSLFI